MMLKFGSRLLFILFLFLCTESFGQETYLISGTIVDEKQVPINGATVFISGSKKMTASDRNGRFSFEGILPGNYTLSASMLGYSTPSHALAIHSQSLNVTFIMKVKPIALNEVKIGTNDDWKRHYALFKDQFLGTSGNAKHCVILNPEVISFSSRKLGNSHIELEADADDLLIIENKQLGYRIKYLLRTFNYNPKSSLTFYDGDSHFEEMKGTEKQKKTWATNRLKAYQGSLMHFLRSVYARNALNEGFIANQMVKSSNVFDPKIYMKPDPVNFDTLLRPVDSSFVAFTFTGLHVAYDPKKASRLGARKSASETRTNEKQPANQEPELSPMDQAGKSSQLILHLEEAVIDERGSILTGYKTFLIRGNWANKRIGDQLPMEYLTPLISD